MEPLSETTVRRLADTGTIKTIRDPSNPRLLLLADVERVASVRSQGPSGCSQTLDGRKYNIPWTPTWIEGSITKIMARIDG